MVPYRRIEVTPIRIGETEVSIVRFVDRKIIDVTNIQELGNELFGLVDKDGKKHLLLNFANVEFLSSAAMNKLFILEKKIRAHVGMLRLCNLRPEIYEVFAIMRVNQLFVITNSEDEALKNWPVPAAV